MNYGKPSFWNSIPPVTKNLIVINLIMWLAAIVLPRFNVNLYDILGMHYWASGKFNVAQMLTYIFMHGSFSHIFFNMFALFMFGAALEQFWGSKRFLAYYLITGVGAGLMQQAVWAIEFQPMLNAMSEAITTGSMEGLIPYSNYFNTDVRNLNQDILVQIKEVFLNNPNFVTVGASGSVFGLLLAFGWLFPQARLMLLFLPIPIPARIFVAVYGLIELFLGVANFSGDSIAHFAHLGGMLFGAILIVYWKRKNGK
ncbi:MAG: rhomboid family intramembrane serine protease [Prevotellaceae bacterium]|jgi:membrane associated rhomboid family serine protease|nr:rhomboid family intramembrane serine protease [Prevotellaceae bacterium]